MCLCLHKGYESKNLSAVMTRGTLSFCFVFSFLFFGGCFVFWTRMRQIVHPWPIKTKRRSPSARKSLDTAGTDKTRPFGQGKLVRRKTHCSHTQWAHSQGYTLSDLDVSTFRCCCFLPNPTLQPFPQVCFSSQTPVEQSIENKQSKKNLIAPQKMPYILSVFVE